MKKILHPGRQSAWLIAASFFFLIVLTCIYLSFFNDEVNFSGLCSQNSWGGLLSLFLLLVWIFLCTEAGWIFPAHKLQLRLSMGLMAAGLIIQWDESFLGSIHVLLCLAAQMCYAWVWLEDALFLHCYSLTKAAALIILISIVLVLINGYVSLSAQIVFLDGFLILSCFFIRSMNANRTDKEKS